jgi:hypothetical protein
MRWRRQWCCWRFELAPDQKKPAKVPYSARSGRKINPTDSLNGASFDLAVKAYEYKADRYNGIGFMLLPDDPYTITDLDNCVDIQTGQIKPAARKVVERFGRCYVEKSVSGTGLHLVSAAKKPGPECKGTLHLDGEELACEMYDNARYIAMTGATIDGSARTIEDGQEAVDWLYGKLFPAPALAPPPTPSTATGGGGSPSPPAAPQPPTPAGPHNTTPVAAILTDDELLEKAFAAKNGAVVERLYQGEQLHYPSDSEADAALLMHLAFYTQSGFGGGVSQLERLARSSQRCRPKWDEMRGSQTWIEAECADAADKVSNTYSPGGKAATTPPVAANTGTGGGGSAGNRTASSPSRGHRKPQGVGGKSHRHRQQTGTTQGAGAKTRPKKSQADLLVDIAKTATLFHEENHEPFARFRIKGHWETWGTHSKAFRDWLSYRFHAAFNKAPSSQGMKDAQVVIDGICRFEGPCHPLQVRVARTGVQELWLDLSNSDWQAVHVTDAGWQVVDDPPLLFRRYAVCAPQSEPVPGGDLLELRGLLNLHDEGAWRLIVSWLVAALIPDLPHPVLCLYGEQGCAKSTLMRLLSLLIDLSRTPSRTEPRDVPAWAQTAAHSWFIGLDNLSQLPGWLSDCFCRAVTGEGFSKRQLYSDDDDIVYSFRRVIGLTGIEVVASRADLLDRSLLIGLEPIPPSERRRDEEVLSAFEQARPRLLGALLDILVGVLGVLPRLCLKEMPRMADFFLIGHAVERVLGWPAGAFASAFEENGASQHTEALAGSSVGTAVLALMETERKWDGLVKDLLDKLTVQVGEGKARQRDWPKGSRTFVGALRRAAPSLRHLGVSVTIGGHTRNGYTVSLERRAAPSSPDQGAFWASTP